VFDGVVLKNADHTPAARTVQDVVDRINNALDTVMVANDGHIEARIAGDGVSLEIEDTMGGGPPSNFTITSSPTNAYAARDLGIEKTGDGSGIINGDRVIAGLNSVLVRSLNGGNGLNGNTTLDITDREGDFRSFALDEDWSLSEIIDFINDSGDMIDLGTLGGSKSQAEAINDAGYVVGFTDTPSGRRAFIWSDANGNTVHAWERHRVGHGGLQGRFSSWRLP